GVWFDRKSSHPNRSIGRLPFFFFASLIHVLNDTISRVFSFPFRFFSCQWR
ncbi:hypothetical protein B0H12DRAFT_1097010, partial [Mycena haematopus]